MTTLRPEWEKASSMVVADAKVAYIASPKAACTSIRWLLNDLAGTRVGPWVGARSGETTRNQLIHSQGTRALNRLDDEQRAAITAENGWFFFTVVRHPFARVWSGWQDKFLLRNPRFARIYGSEPWFPRVPETTDDIREDFAAFVDALGTVKRLRKDRHFSPQVEVLRPNAVKFTHVYTTAEFSTMIDDLGAHVRQTMGRELPPLVVANDTPLKPAAGVFTEPVLDALHAMYDVDLQQWDFPEWPEPTLEEYAPHQLAEVDRLIQRHERIGVLTSVIRNRDQRIAELEELLAGRTG